MSGLIGYFDFFTLMKAAVCSRNMGVGQNLQFVFICDSLYLFMETALFILVLVKAYI